LFHPPPRRPSAFTLLELLVVLAIVAVLLGLLLPAVQKARAAVQRAACLNNLRQMGLALHAYHNIYGTFPAGGIEWRPPGNTTRRQLAWSAFLLPYLEQDAVAKQLDLSLPFDHPANAPAAATVLSVYLCPAVGRVNKLVDGRGACDYGGIFGERITGPNNPPKGVMLYDEPVGIAGIPDGTAQTLILSEDSGWLDGQWINGRNIFDVAYAINRAPAFENDIRSKHPGGANGLFCDGSARFLKESMELKTLAALCTRAGRETVLDF
jgi:prepilin-type N-terminal cleavage/methylation domain-containing protein/prepilin-type processing-associated H-X9-DG protein